LERYLQLAANDNICVVNCTTAAQYYHLLRRQAARLNSHPRPLIVMSPKFLLRHSRAASSISDLTEGSFQPVINDTEAEKRAEAVTRLILCSGKIYMDMAFESSSPFAPRAAFVEAQHAALVRIEELYPFPADALQKVIAGYPNLKEVVWMQEEPRNMGAWSFVEPRIRELADWSGPIIYVGRREAASPAEGSMTQHLAEQQRILSDALDTPPALMADLETESAADREPAAGAAR
jgi:2-oxoglutarate dehydrogenase E1 component